MVKDASVDELFRLARLAGIETSYVDIFGAGHDVDIEPLIAILRALGHDLDSVASSKGVLAEALNKRWHFAVEPVAVAWEGREGGIEVRCPLSASGPVRCDLVQESGEASGWTVELQEIDLAGSETIGGREFGRRRLKLPPLPLGYHTARVRHAAFEQDVLIIAAPATAYEPNGKATGVFAPLYALHSAHSWGAGDISDFEAFADWLKRYGGSFVATLPLLSQFIDEGSRSVSPYSPVSKLFWNEFYIDAERAARSMSCPEGEALLRSAETEAALREIRAAPHIAYGRIHQLKKSLLMRLAACADLDIDRLPPGIVEYAKFRATCDAQAEPWQKWPARLRDGDLDAAVNSADFRYYCYAQSLVSRQLQEFASHVRGQDQMTYLDLPIGSDASGFDTWKFRGQFATGVSCGAPPDSLFGLGQDWGLPPPIPERSRETHYAYFRSVLEHHLSVANILRFDHVIGLHRLYWVAEGFGARKGVFVRYRSDELYAILCLESQRRKAVIIGENLGTVPPEVNEAMRRHGIFESYVLQYELAPVIGSDMRRPPKHSLASLNTHDMPTFAGFWAGRDIELRQRLGLMADGDVPAEQATREGEKEVLVSTLQAADLLTDASAGPDEVYNATLKWLSQSEAQLILLNLEDLWLEPEPQNIPGTVGDNWQRPSRRAIEELPDLQATLPPLGEPS